MCWSAKLRLLKESVVVDCVALSNYIHVYTVCAYVCMFKYVCIRKCVFATISLHVNMYLFMYILCKCYTCVAHTM